jgi:hypothetical protein
VPAAARIDLYLAAMTLVGEVLAMSPGSAGNVAVRLGGVKHC